MAAGSIIILFMNWRWWWAALRLDPRPPAPARPAERGRGALAAAATGFMGRKRHRAKRRGSPGSVSDFGGEMPPWCQQPIPLGEDAAEMAGCFEAIAREHHLADARSQTRIGLALQSLLLLLERRAEGSRDVEAAQSELNPRQTHTVDSAAHYFRNNLRDPLSVRKWRHIIPFVRDISRRCSGASTGLHRAALFGERGCSGRRIC